MVSSECFADSDITLLENVTIRCEQPRGGFAFSIPQGNEGARIWSTDQGKNEGLELTDVRFEKLRCINCFNLQGTVNLMGTSMTEMFSIRAMGFNAPKLTVTVGNQVLFKDVPCETL